MHPDEIVLHDYVDDALGRAERTEIERHLTTCADCRRVVDEVRELGRRMSSLDPMQPPSRVWRRIERDIVRSAGLEPRDRGAAEAAPSVWNARGRRYAIWLAAAAVLLLAAAVGLRVMTRSQPASTTTADAAPDAQAIAAELALAEQHYQKAITGLEQIANAEKGALDARTAATLQKNLAVIDRAITESRAALTTQPNSEPAQQILLESFKTKIALLQDTVALINEMRKGNDAGAARIVSGLKEKS